jgi:hypothetical protein
VSAFKRQNGVTGVAGTVNTVYVIKVTTFCQTGGTGTNRLRNANAVGVWSYDNVILEGTQNLVGTPTTRDVSVFLHFQAVPRLVDDRFVINHFQSIIHHFSCHSRPILV